jgi:NAD(P)-dependent dehydrogenase (short-subunit alcohol dehydrogenase family)
MTFDGTIGLVTGAASGIGRATAELLAGEGATVAVLDVHDRGGNGTIDAITAAGGSAPYINCNVEHPNEIEDAINTVVARYGRLDWAHNNAGVSGAGVTTDALTVEQWDKVMRIDARGAWLSMRYELAVMRQQGRGAIVNTSSVCAFQAAQQTSPYNAAKHAVVGMTKEAAIEFARLGIRVNAVRPGYTAHPWHSTPPHPRCGHKWRTASRWDDVANPQKSHKQWPGCFPIHPRTSPDTRSSLTAACSKKCTALQIKRQHELVLMF